MLHLFFINHNFNIHITKYLLNTIVLQTLHSLTKLVQLYIL